MTTDSGTPTASEAPASIPSMGSDPEIDALLRQLGATVRDDQLGQQTTALYTLDDQSIRDVLGPGADEARAMQLWGITLSDLWNLGKDLWNRVSPRLHDVFCNPQSEYHGRIAGLLVPGKENLAAAVAALVVNAVGGLLPAIATATAAYFIAKLVIRIFVEGGYTLACDRWAKTLATTPAS
jgi:hypothetical protein